MCIRDSGYAGGYTPNATYREVCSGETGHAEVVLVVFDPATASFETLLKTFWESHDPTQGMRQGNDTGTQYRSAIYCETEAQHVVALASRCLLYTSHRQGLPLSVLYIDVDHFKSVNDRMGHAAGDHCLREIARLVGAGLVDEDQFGRYGGEEFLVVLPGRQTEMARAIAEQIRRAVEDAELRHEDRPLRTTVSIGVATMLAEDANPQQVVERADKALYAAKRGGRNRVSVAPAVFAPRPATALSLIHI